MSVDRAVVFARAFGELLGRPVTGELFGLDEADLNPAKPTENPNSSAEPPTSPATAATVPPTDWDKVDLDAVFGSRVKPSTKASASKEIADGPGKHGAEGSTRREEQPRQPVQVQWICSHNTGDSIEVTVLAHVGGRLVPADLPLLLPRAFLSKVSRVDRVFALPRDNWSTIDVLEYDIDGQFVFDGEKIRTRERSDTVAQMDPVAAVRGIVVAMGNLVGTIHFNEFRP